MIAIKNLSAQTKTLIPLKGLIKENYKFFKYAEQDEIIDGMSDGIVHYGLLMPKVAFEELAKEY
jgi:hypothetical protein